MEKERFTLEQVLNMDLPPIILWAAPFMVSLVLIEWFIIARKQRKKYDGKDSFAAALVGIGNLISSAITRSGMFLVILFFYNLVPWSIPTTWWSYVLCIIGLDFCRYWAHRIAHEQRVLWSTHVTHHSSEQYNWTVSFRLSWFQQIKVIFFIPMAMAGFHPVVFFICHQIEVLYQFWIHTELIRKLPKPIEYIFTTPSHHRVHHARNQRYLDKNYGSTLIIWDRIFGTFQAEDETPEYGILQPVNSYNPIKLVFHELVDLVKDLRHANSFRHAMYILFGSPNQLLEKYERKSAAGPIDENKPLGNEEGNEN